LFQLNLNVGNNILNHLIDDGSRRIHANGCISTQQSREKSFAVKSELPVNKLLQTLSKIVICIHMRSTTSSLP
ncbi:MAG: hypothetical protein ACXADW_20915, partial [Candidatus Hodarchaeales archaeon]